MVGAGHDRFPAKPPNLVRNPPVIGRDQNMVQTWNRPNTLVDALDDRFSIDAFEGLARETARPEACGYDSN
jgi:hypothetical protein